MQREKWIDALRGGVILLVVIGHSGCPEIVYNFIYSFHMPLFFIISGYLFNYDKWIKKGTWSFIKSRVKAYIKPYLILCGVNYVLCLIEEVIRSGISDDMLVLMKTWLFGILYAYPNVEYMPNCTPLWFLVALTSASILLFFVLKIPKLEWQIVTVVFVAIIDAVLAKTVTVQLPWCFGAILIGCCCMYVGQVIKKYSVLVVTSHKFVLFLVCAVGFISSYINGRVGIGANIIGNNPVLFWISALCLPLVVMSLVSKVGNRLTLLQWYGRNTILFMGFNYFFNTLTSFAWYHVPYLNQYNYNWVVKSLACVICISILILLWNKIKERFPHLTVVGF